MHVGYVLLNCDLGAEEYILDELKGIPEVKKAYLTFGMPLSSSKMYSSAPRSQFNKT